MSNKSKEISVANTLIKNRIVIAVVLAIFIIFGIVAVASLRVVSSFIVNEANYKYQVIADNVEEQITTWFSNEAQIVLNQKAAIEINDEFDPDELTAYLTRIVEDYNDEGYIYDLYFVNTDNVMSSGYGYIPDPSIDFRTRPWYENTLDMDGLFYSAPYKDSNLDRYVVTISTTCYKSDGELAGVLALDIFVDTLFSIVEDKVLDGNSYAFLVDNNMGIATHPNMDYSYVDDEPIAVSSVDGNIYRHVVDVINNGENIDLLDFENTIEDYDGVDRTIYVSKIDCCGWYVVAAIDTSVFYAPLIKVLFAVGIALIVCMIVGITLSRLASNNIIRRLNHANEEARLANEAKGVFLANMSHEIRTPINAIIGMNEMVIRENNDPKINDYALDIASASRSLVTVVNDILDFSKIDSGKMEIIKSEFSIASIINDVINMSESRLGNKELALFFRIDPNIPAKLIGDEVRIKQVILNMMTNAIKYTNIGYITMRVEFSNQEYGGNLNVFVKDSGIGISEENLEQLFESFKRFDAQRNRSIEGTGLGLAITKRLVNSMGGFINVTSELGVGSEFSFSIPLQVADAKPFVSVENPDNYKIVSLFNFDDMDVKIRRETSNVINSVEDGLNMKLNIVSSIEKLQDKLKDDSFTHVFVDNKSYFANESYFEELSHKKVVLVLQKRGNAIELPKTVVSFYTPFNVMSLAAFLNNKRYVEAESIVDNLTFTAPEARILIVDDNAMNLKVAAGLMKPYDMRITTVDSGVKAVDLLKEDPTYDIVFMDHMMPIMDGIEATKIIREMEDSYYKNLPIIALTANTINNAKKMFMDAGFDDFVAKPINVVFLDRVLREYLPEEKRVVAKSADEINANNNSAEIKEDSSLPEEKEDKKCDEFNPSLGLSYTGGNVGLYLDILKEYVETSPDMKSLIKTSYDEEDWANYVIKVHALKSTSLTIGAEPLSTLAKELELSGKANNLDPILEKTDTLLKEYDSVLLLASEYLKSKGIEVVFDAPQEETADLSSINAKIAIGYIDQFHEAIDDFDTDRADEIFEQVCKAGEEYRNLFKNAVNHINNFEYDEANEILNRIADDLNNN